MLLQYNWPNKIKLLPQMPILVKQSETTRKQFSFALSVAVTFGNLHWKKLCFYQGKWEFSQKKVPYFPLFFPFSPNLPTFDHISITKLYSMAVDWLSQITTLIQCRFVAQGIIRRWREQPFQRVKALGGQKDILLGFNP